MHMPMTSMPMSMLQGIGVPPVPSGDGYAVTLPMQSSTQLQNPDELFVCLDGEGRISGTDPKLDTSFRCWEGAFHFEGVPNP